VSRSNIGCCSKLQTIVRTARRGGMSDAPTHATMQAKDIRNRIVGVNVPNSERIASAIASGAVILVGLRRRSLGGIAIAGLGAVMMVRAISGRCPVYRSRALRKGVRVRRAITVQATPQQVYEIWRDLERLPRFMRHVSSVTLEGNRISRWVVKEGPKQLEWRAEILEDTPNRRIRWKSLPGGDIEHEGVVEISEAPADRGTIIDVKLQYFPPGGLFVASALAGFLRKLTSVQIGEELARLQQLVETGEITTGARRLDELGGGAKVLGVTPVPAHAPQPATTAQRSTWGVDVTGGTR
jgi:uncharacterized membrane protein